MIYYLLYFIPKNLLSFFVGILAQRELPFWINQKILSFFVKTYKINMEEAELPLENYKSLDQLFVRALKPGLRPIGEGFIHPVDSKLSQICLIREGQLVQAKGKFYSLAQFLKLENGLNENKKNYNNKSEKSLFKKSDFKDEELQKEKLQKWEGGFAITYYLCPTDYHRVHSPVEGEITAIDYVPGRLWPVNPWSVEHISQLFSVNERLIIWLDSPQGQIAYVMVGATNVGKMTLSFDKDVVTNNSHRRHGFYKKYSRPIPINKGAELGCFHLGSTVVVVTPSHYFSQRPIGIGESVKWGESLHFHE